MKYLLIDGNNLLHRTYWIAKYNEKEGSNLYIELFLRSIKTYTEMYHPDYIICTWDKKMHLEEGEKNFNIQKEIMLQERLLRQGQCVQQ